VGTIYNEVVGGRHIAVLISCAALAAVPSCALAQGAFPDYRQAAADQYPTQPPPANNGSGGQNGGSSGAPHPAHHPRPGHHGSGGHKPGNASGVKSDTAGGSEPVAVPTRPVHAAKGSLPFTGSDLSGLVVLALALIAAGFLLAGAERATRRRRAPA
jgi:hypothetical protein